MDQPRADECERKTDQDTECGADRCPRSNERRWSWLFYPIDPNSTGFRRAMLALARKHTSAARLTS